MDNTWWYPWRSRHVVILLFIGLLRVLGVTSRFVCPTPYGKFPHPDCSRFYVCSSSVVFLMACPAGLHFNPALQVCDWKTNVICGGNNAQTGGKIASDGDYGDSEIQEDPDGAINGQEFSPVVTTTTTTTRRPTTRPPWYPWRPWPRRRVSFYWAKATTPRPLDEGSGSGAV